MLINSQHNVRSGRTCITKTTGSIVSRMGTSPFTNDPPSDALYTTTITDSKQTITILSRAITELTGTDTTDREPIYESIDPEIIDQFLSANHNPGQNARIVFTAWGFEIFLFADGTLYICNSNPGVNEV